jgi:hypothetical protein
MRRVSSVDPEQLRKFCQYRLTPCPNTVIDGPSLGVPTDVWIRELELAQYGLAYGCLLPGTSSSRSTARCWLLGTNCW